MGPSAHKVVQLCTGDSGDTPNTTPIVDHSESASSPTPGDDNASTSATNERKSPHDADDENEDEIDRRPMLQLMSNSAFGARARALRRPSARRLQRGARTAEASVRSATSQRRRSNVGRRISSQHRIAEHGWLVCVRVQASNIFGAGARIGRVVAILGGASCWR